MWRTVPRPQQRHPLDLSRTALRLRRRRGARLSRRYSGLDPARRRAGEDHAAVRRWHSSKRRHHPQLLARPCSTDVAVDNLIARGINILFTVGGDGTQRGANDLYQEAPPAATRCPSWACRRPSTTTLASSRAHSDSSAPSKKPRGCSIARTPRHAACPAASGLKLMGRHAGFVTAGATVASQDVNFALIPEVPFELEAFLAALKQRMLANRTPSSPSRGPELARRRRQGARCFRQCETQGHRSVFTRADRGVF